MGWPENFAPSGGWFGPRSLLRLSRSYGAADTVAGVMGKKSQTPDCQVAKLGGNPCQIDLPKPNQLCAACRPFWAKSKVKRASARA